MMHTEAFLGGGYHPSLESHTLFALFILGTGGNYHPSLEGPQPPTASGRTPGDAVFVCVGRKGGRERRGGRKGGGGEEGRT